LAVLVIVTAARARPARAVESRDVNVVNTPTVNARQSGAWDVGIDRARIPFQRLANLFIPDGDVGGIDEFVVPAGHRLIIEQVTGSALVPAGQVVYLFQVITAVGGVFAEHFIPVTATPVGSIACQQVRLYADPGTAVKFAAFRNGTDGEVLAGGSISGYLVPVP
jgi:hypothetical protein